MRLMNGKNTSKNNNNNERKKERKTQQITDFIVRAIVAVCATYNSVE